MTLYGVYRNVPYRTVREVGQVEQPKSQYGTIFALAAADGMVVEKHNDKDPKTSSSCLLLTPSNLQCEPRASKNSACPLVAPVLDIDQF